MPSLALAWHLMSVQVPEPPDVSDGVRWDAPFECPGRAAVLDGIARRLGRALAPGEVTVDARVVRERASRFVMRLHLAAGARSESRELTATTCAPLDEHALVLPVVHAVDIWGDGITSPITALLHRVSFAGEVLSTDPLTPGNALGSPWLIPARGECGDLVLYQHGFPSAWLGSFAP